MGGVPGQMVVDLLAELPLYIGKPGMVQAISQQLIHTRPWLRLRNHRSGW